MIHPIAGNPVLEVVELGWPWAAQDPFLLCAHHTEHYPAGDAAFGAPLTAIDDPQARKAEARDQGYNLYFSLDGVPGFPNHPHRGMETVSILKRGYIDHADSLGSYGRYGPGDVQWMTAGEGIQHSEMFPLLHQDQPNEFELFQIWLNMPAATKMVEPAYKMMWAEEIPHYHHKGADVAVIAGVYQPVEQGQDAIVPCGPTPDSWAAQAKAELAIWLVTLPPASGVTLPPAVRPDNQRTLFVPAGKGLHLAGQKIGANRRVRVVAQMTLALTNDGPDEAVVMVMQGVPLEEPMVRSTVYVTNTIEELHQAKRDFQRTEFGGWPWPNRQPMHGAGFARFARYQGQAEPDCPPAPDPSR